MNLRMRLLLTAFILIFAPTANAVARHPEPSPHDVLGKKPAPAKTKTAAAKSKTPKPRAKKREEGAS